MHLASAGGQRSATLSPLCWCCAGLAITIATTTKAIIVFSRLLATALQEQTLVGPEKERG
ncbi:MAG TPA: hypothetical protein VH593_16290 [Ktedonobacteraceae bacterium]